MNIRLITVQSKEVADSLLKGNIHYARKREDYFLQPVYNKMCEAYGYENNPVFAGVVGRRCEFLGAPREESYIIEIDVPEELVKIQNYYDWSDMIYYTEEPKEWAMGSEYPLKEFFKNTLEGKNTHKKSSVIQATIPYIDPNWVHDIIPLTEKFNDLHIGSGGNNVLMTLEFYKANIEL